MTAASAFFTQALPNAAAGSAAPVSDAAVSGSAAGPSFAEVLTAREGAGDSMAAATPSAQPDGQGRAAGPSGSLRLGHGRTQIGLQYRLNLTGQDVYEPDAPIVPGPGGQPGSRVKSGDDPTLPQTNPGPGPDVQQGPETPEILPVGFGPGLSKDVDQPQINPGPAVSKTSAVPEPEILPTGFGPGLPRIIDQPQINPGLAVDKASAVPEPEILPAGFGPGADGADGQDAASTGKGDPQAKATAAAQVAASAAGVVQPLARGVRRDIATSNAAVSRQDGQAKAGVAAVDADDATSARPAGDAQAAPATAARPAEPPLARSEPRAPVAAADAALLSAGGGTGTSSAEAPVAQVDGLKSASANLDRSVSHLARTTIDATAQISAQIIRKLEGRSTRFEMALTPEELGRVDVKLDIDADGKLAARLAFDNPAAATDLRGRVDELRRQLLEAGFQLAADAFEFAERDSQSSAFDRGQDHQASSRRAFAQADQITTDADVAAARWVSLGQSPDRVDVRI